MDKAKLNKTRTSDEKIVIYGGNGFVGTRVAEHLANQDISTVCLSRSGYKPIHLKNTDWSESVRWCKGDASKPDANLLSTSTTLIALVGSPPVPTFSAAAYEQQVFMNGTTNVNVINAAANAGIKRLVLLGAKLPFLLNHDRFGYAKGKRLALEAAQEFAELSNEHTAVVLQPGAIFGTRYLKSGKAIALGTILKPLSMVMPWQFIAVEKVASCIADAALSADSYHGKFTIVSHRDIQDGFGLIGS